jgi:SWI/SNF-related matrix-associated actin-dependent regulator 1 of chromatin subfamily A
LFLSLYHFSSATQDVLTQWVASARDTEATLLQRVADADAALAAAHSRERSAAADAARHAAAAAAAEEQAAAEAAAREEAYAARDAAAAHAHAATADAAAARGEAAEALRARDASAAAAAAARARAEASAAALGASQAQLARTRAALAPPRRHRAPLLLRASPSLHPNAAAATPAAFRLPMRGGGGDDYDDDEQQQHDGADADTFADADDDDDDGRASRRAAELDGDADAAVEAALEGVFDARTPGLVAYPVHSPAAARALVRGTRAKMGLRGVCALALALTRRDLTLFFALCPFPGARACVCQAAELARVRGALDAAAAFAAAALAAAPPDVDTTTDEADETDANSDAPNGSSPPDAAPGPDAAMVARTPASAASSLRARRGGALSAGVRPTALFGSGAGAGAGAAGEPHAAGVLRAAVGALARRLARAAAHAAVKDSRLRAATLSLSEKDADCTRLEAQTVRTARAAHNVPTVCSSHAHVSLLLPLDCHVIRASWLRSCRCPSLTPLPAKPPSTRAAPPRRRTPPRRTSAWPHSQMKTRGGTGASHS